MTSDAHSPFYCCMCRRLGEESDGESSRDSSSDGSSDSELDRGGSSYSGDKSPRVGPSLLREHHMEFQEGFSSDEGESGSSEGSLLFEYLARDQPYCREPLADKVSCLFDILLKFLSSE